MLRSNAPRLITLGAFAAFFLGLCCTAVTLYYLPGYKAHQLAWLAGLLLGGGLAVANLSFGSSLTEVFAQTWRYYAAIAAAAASVALLTYWCGMRQFGGFDHSIVVDYAWRLSNGQRPFIDFPSTAPVGFVVGAYYAFAAFGASWQSLVMASAIFSVVTFLWSVWLLGQLYENRRFCLTMACAIQALCTIPVSYWWYNPIAVTSGVMFSLSAFVWLRQPELPGATISYALSLLLLATMKANVAGFLIPIVTLILFTSRRHAWRVVLVSAAGLAAFLLLLHAHGIGLIDCVNGYRSVSNRAFTIGQFFTDVNGTRVTMSREGELSIAALLLAVLPLGICCLSSRQRKLQWRALLIGLACAAAGVTSFVTAGDLKVLDIGFVLIGVMLACDSCGLFALSWTWRRPNLSQLATGLVTSLAIIFGCLGVAQGVSRHRVLGIGPNMFFEYTFDQETIETGFFKGLRRGRIFKEVYAQAESVASESKNRRVFFGPRMQWGYAAFGLPPPMGQPVWWHPGVSFPLADQAKQGQSFLEMKNDTLIMFKNDMTFYSPELIAAVRQHYTEDQSFSRLTVFHLNR